MDDHVVTRRLTPSIDGGVVDGIVSVVVADVVGSSAITNRIGDEAWLALRHTADEVVHLAIARHGGRFVNRLGDGWLAVFGSARRALRFADEVSTDVPAASNGDLELRVGVTAGDVICDGDDLVGAALNLAARLVGLAEPGAVCCADVVTQLVGACPEFRFGGPESVVVKGFGSPVPVRSLDRRVPAGTTLGAAPTRELRLV